MGHDKLAKAQEVVAARDAEPHKYQPLVEKMNENGKVHGAYKKLQTMRAAEKIRAEPLPVTTATAGPWGRCWAGREPHPLAEGRLSC